MVAALILSVWPGSHARSPPVTKIFGDRVSCALSGGYDSRLILGTPALPGVAKGAGELRPGIRRAHNWRALKRLKTKRLIKSPSIIWLARDYGSAAG
jgi:hypothetical protein